MSDKLLYDLKKEVKQIVEEAVTRKFIHADSTSITSLCAVVDAIIQHGLKRRARGILPPCDSETMLLKLAELSPPTETLVRKLMGLDVDDSIIEVTKPSVPVNEINKFEIKKIRKFNLENCKLPYGKSNRFLWIRCALVEKILAQVVASLVEHSHKFYEPHAVLADPVEGPLVANLLAGPCALDYSKMKTPDSRWSDPSADELVQRHRIHSGISLRRRKTSFSKPKLAEHSPSVEEFIVAPSLAREHVESLHQNAATTMLFGKNNVDVQPASCSEWIPGYLSLHQTSESLLLKWTPNDLMSGSPNEHQILSSNEAITIDTLDVVYVHCHNKGEPERVMVLIAQDGVQRPPIRFPTTGSLMRFLECLETGLNPYGRLDPPLTNSTGNGTLFDKSTTRGTITKPSFSRDYVFRLVPSIKPEDIGLDSNLNLWATSKKSSSKKKKLRKLSEKSKTRPVTQRYLRKQQVGLTRASLESACQTMKNQIMYRALKGWLSHVHYLCTVRKHLSSLIEPTVLEEDEIIKKGLTKERWSEIYRNQKLNADEIEIAKLVYHGGVQHEIRRLVWPYLLGYHKFGSTLEERTREDGSRMKDYNKLLTEWMDVEELLCQPNHVSETDRDSAQDSTASKEGSFNEDPEKSTPDKASLCNGELTNGELTNGGLTNGGLMNGGQQANGELTDDDLQDLHDETAKASPNSELDNESGCYDTSMEKCSVCGLEINGGFTASREGLTNGCHRNGKDAHDNHVGDRKYCACKNSTHNLSGLYSDTLLENFALNIHRIDKDVLRCDRNYPYFKQQNLDKLRRIMCTYVWNTLDIGYVQGMCDLLAPLLVIFDDEAKSYHCFVLLMKRMDCNFPHGGAMDNHFANMRSLIQILDPELFEVMQHNGDLIHCYFCYRWFLLDFKREFLYDDIFRVWECIWAAQISSSKHFVLFIALALLKSYRNIVIDHGMDFTDVIKFFNEMAERHNATQILDIARNSVKQVETLIQND